MFSSCHSKKNIDITIPEQADDNSIRYTYSASSQDMRPSITISGYGAYFFNNGVMKKIPSTEPLGDSVYWRSYIIFNIERSASKLIYNTENGAVSDVLSGDERTGSTRVGFFPLETSGADLLFYLDGIAYELDPVTLTTINRYVWEKAEEVHIEYGYLRDQNGLIVPWKENAWVRTIQWSIRKPDLLHFIVNEDAKKYILVAFLPDMLSQSKYYAYNGIDEQLALVINDNPPKTFDDFAIDYTFKIQQNGSYTIDTNFNLIPLHLNDYDNPMSNAFIPTADKFEHILFISDHSGTKQHLLFDPLTGMTKVITVPQINYIEFINQNKLIVHGESEDWDNDENKYVYTDMEIEINFDNRNTSGENIGRHIYRDYNSKYSFHTYLRAKFINHYGNKRLFELYNKNIVIEYEDEFSEEYPDSDYHHKYNFYVSYNEKSNIYLIWVDDTAYWLAGR